MRRAEIDKAARDFLHNYDHLDSVSRGSWAMLDFAIQQINAALEEAAKEMDKVSAESWQGDRIRALKIGD